jgi:chromosome segregation protein
MYLSNIEIVGFKSFAQKTALKFTDGLTAIVGPNGCGKTNIVDALRWVLGEQKTSVLRSDVMEDVIFNGTSKRKPLGMAEVSLILQNNKGVLPTEYNEVKLTRRLFRDGTSNYYLNNTHCRLRDILDLFMDTGLGSDSYSVIELKMVEAILAGKPEERRNLVEEAAGVKKYKQRRKEANRKLQTIQSDLLRVQDIAVEVEKQVESLSRQAAKTRRYNKLTEQLKSLEVNLLYCQFNDYHTNIELIGNDLKDLKQKKFQKENELIDNENDLTKLKDILNNQEEQYRVALESENSIISQIATLNQDIAVSNEKISSLNLVQERIKNELSEFGISYSDIERQLNSVTNSLNIVEEKREQTENELAEKKEVRDAIKSSVVNARESASFSNEEVIGFQNEINSLYNDIDRGKNRKSSLERSINESLKEIDELKLKYAKANQDIEIEQEKIVEFKDRIAVNEKTYQLAQEEQQSLQSSIESLKDNISDLKNDLNGKKASLEFLSTLSESNESNKFLLADDSWTPKSGKSLLAEIIDTDDKYRIAVGAALGDYSKCFVVENKNEADSAVQSLLEFDKGKATFLIKETVPQCPAPNDFTKKDGVYGWVSELIRADESLKNALRIILGKTLLVENSEIALELIRNKECSAAVTINGDIIHNEFSIRAGSLVQSEGVFVGKNERIKQLGLDIDELEKSIQIFEENLNNLKNEYDSIDLIDLNNKVRRAEAEKNSLEQIISQMRYKAEGIEQNINVLIKNNEIFQNEISSLESDVNKAKDRLVELDNNLNLAREQQLSRTNELKNLEEQLSEQEAEYREIELKKIRYEQEKISLRKEINSFSERKTNLEFTEQKRKSEILSNENEIENLKIKVTELENQLVTVKESNILAQNKREQLAEEIKSIKEQVNQYSDSISLIRRENEKLSEGIHQYDLKISELKAKVENVKSRAFEGYEIDLEQLEIVLDSEFSIADTKTEVTDLKDKLSKLGNVNFMALEEFDSQSERLTFYTNQLNDLFESEKNLIETIDEINQTAQLKFLETFNKVNKFFQGLFKTLFSQDAEAELILSDGDPLEAAIEIMAKPPGKKPRTIESLSGGEKTLTAIALLFAIYLVKPSPFCILDEVDAPLDDANIGRYINLIRDFSKDTQFLIVTHNKKTMEAADSLYGITMEEEGVSKVVSVRFNQEENGNN